MDASEIELVRAIRKVLSGDAPGVVIGVGDDAAIVEPGRHQGVLTTDMLVEGVHFELGATSPHDLGHKAVTVNVSDVAAMGGSPRYGLVALAVPRETETAWVMELYGGMREAADEYAMALIGGDTSKSDRATVSMTVVGEVASGRAVTRSGARPGDVVAVTGALGASAGGLRVARAQGEQQKELLSTEWGRALLSAHERPVARVGEGQALAAAGATSMMDISDGLALDVARLCEASAVGVELRAEDVPLADGLDLLAEATGVDALDLALHGGEDYELLVTLPPEGFEAARDRLQERFSIPLTRVGEVVGREELTLVREGRHEALDAKGWDHFAE